MTPAPASTASEFQGSPTQKPSIRRPSTASTMKDGGNTTMRTS
jgi:hypothetical protein